MPFVAHIAPKSISATRDFVLDHTKRDYSVLQLVLKGIVTEQEG